MPELNAPQREAVEHTQGPLLIFAGAGSGKTRTITYRIANLLANNVPPYRILAVTFTNKAAGEMRTRLERLAGEGVVRDLWVGTFHSVCARLLRRAAEEVGLTRNFTIYDDSDQKAVVGRALKELGIDPKRFPPKHALSRIMLEKREGRSPAEAEFAGDFDNVLSRVYERYQNALRTSNAVDFEDLLSHVMRIAEDPGSRAGEDLRRRFQHVLVDEFQDTNSVQYRLVRALAARERNLCVVGDDDQSIYGWRGADVRLIRGFRRDFPDASVIKLEQNYRSSSNIVQAALAVIERAEFREDKRLWTEQGAGDPILLRTLPDEHEEARFVARKVRDELGRGTKAHEIAVFYRVHAQSRVLEEALRGEGIAYQIIGGMKFFDRAEVKNLLAYLRLIENPASDADLLRIINLPVRGIGDKTIGFILDTATESATSAYAAIRHLLQDDTAGAAKRKLQAFFELMERLREAHERLGPRELAELVLEESGYRQTLVGEDSAEADARLENLDEFLGSISDYAEEVQSQGEKASLSGYLERVSLVAATDTLDDQPKVSLMTVHSAKGLEFDAVLLTGMEEDIFPYRRVDADETEDVDEERRLAYVAITRARQRLFITHVGARSLFGNTRYLEPSRFLKELPESTLRREGNSASQRPARYGSWSSPAPSRFGTSFGGSSAANTVVKPIPGSRIVDRSAFDDVAHDGEGLQRGARVRHRKFGHGIVRQVDGSFEPSALVEFEDGNLRKILAAYLTPS